MNDRKQYAITDLTYDLHKVTEWLDGLVGSPLHDYKERPKNDAMVIKHIDTFAIVKVADGTHQVIAVVTTGYV